VTDTKMIAVADKVVVPYSSNEGENFVPQSFALAKLKIASSEYVELKRSYEEYIIELKESHEQHCQQNQLFYEEYIREVKKKAKFHVEGQRNLKEKIESDFQNQVANLDEVIERLRDQLTDLRLTHQEESRALRRQFSEAKDSEIKLRDLSTDEFILKECAGVISDVLLRVEMSFLMLDQEDERSDASKRFSILTADINKLNDEAKAQQKFVQNEKDIEFQCKETLHLILYEIENKEWQKEKEMLKTAEKTIVLLSANSSEAELLKAQEYSRLAEELQMVSKGREAEVALLLQRYEEAVTDHEKQIQIQDDASAVLEVEACLQRLIHEIERNHDSLLLISATHDTATTAATAVQQLKEKDTERAQILEKECGTDNDLLVSQLKDQIIRLANNLDQALVCACLDSILARVCDGDRYVCDGDGYDTIPSPKKTETTLGNDLLLKEKIKFLEEQVDQLNKAAAATGTQILAKQMPFVAAHEDTSNPSITVIVPDNNEAKVKEIAREEALRNSLINVQGMLKLATESLVPLGEEKEVNKTKIQRWVTDFTKDNGREPTDEDKKLVRGEYQAYQKSSKSFKAATALVSSLEMKIKGMEEELSKLTADRIAKEGDSVESIDTFNINDVSLISSQSPLKSPSQKMGRQPSFKRAASLKRIPSLVNTNNAKDLEAVMEENNAAIEGLEDKIYQLQQDLEATFIANAKGAEDNLILTEQLAALIKEKRTDIVKRYEEQIVTLKAEGETLQINLTELKTIKANNERRIIELNERAEVAEGELKTRDVNEQKGLNPKDEKSALKLQVGKQRDDIVMKAKAATAGWYLYLNLRFHLCSHLRNFF
jgi:hypothetical protein